MTSILLLSVLLLSSYVSISDAAFAQGSPQLIFHPRNGKSSDQHPLIANLTTLWCQAAENSAEGVAERVEISKAHFLHFGSEQPDKSYTARISDNKAYLDFGQRDLFVAGKYRCEITTKEEEFVYGNMFIYLRPVFHTNGSMRLDFPNSDGEDESVDRKFELIGSSIKVTQGTTAIINCPALGYPKPDIHWYKDLQLIQESEKYVFVGNELHIRDVDRKDEGKYRCIASNDYPPALDHNESHYEAILDQQLRVSSPLSWLIPLIVIIIILILLFVIIYTCAYWKKRETQRYNVSSQEKKMHDAEQQRLKEIDEEE